MSSVEWELQKSVYSKLTADMGLMSLVTGIYDQVPQGTAFPYVAFEAVHSEDSSNRAVTVTRVALTIGVYARERGSKTVLAIMAAITPLLHQQALAVSGYSLHSGMVTSRELQQLADGLTYRGKMSFVAYLEG